MGNINKLRFYNAEFLNIKAGGMCVCHCDLSFGVFCISLPELWFPF
jgi:hypothetical protein